MIPLSFATPTLLPSIILLGALITAGIVSYRLWAEMTEDLEPASQSEILEELEQAYADGEIDETEFLRVRKLLGFRQGLMNRELSEEDISGLIKKNEPNQSEA
ncbi:hypothetical protein [Singulisphaera sp. PoT]|uniref:hypothetical protein n=1 Tax=Singulisphaera sp. PoT TaxID=3411797 RepID=UPI003BF60C04